MWFKLTKEQQATIRKYRTDNGLPGGARKVEQVKTAPTTVMTDADCQKIAAMVSSSMKTTTSIISSAGTAFGGKSEAVNKKVL